MTPSPRWTWFLDEAGIEAAHWSALGAVDAPDAAVMAFAKLHDRVVLTHDLDFGAILAATQRAKPSVVQIRSGDVRPEAAGPAVVAAVRQMAGDLERGALLTVAPDRMRIRLLPLQPG